jgi:hypothetical protein
MLLVPRQLQRAGMTGSVPYYGGRLTPAQAYAASHPQRPPMPPPTAQARQVQALQHLLDTGVLTGAEFQELRARVAAQE